ncbi:hypothetical protein ACH5RR_027498 [Cinchona calisaya]|uniref:Histidine kinase/HSP90-like ATPase domain-containing protein n=1 Tax=Cinchona calisaya TaxID=153742 RepID=A0ABD2Z7G9_9GENT
MSRKMLCADGEKYEFQDEVSRLVDIIINSLYSYKDIFLRELISNASDVKLDKEKKILSIHDRGIGMTKEDLIKNLGTIAKSGTLAFVEKMQTSGDINLIGQFGVEFYWYVWESKADGAFVISEDVWNEPLGRGTEIRLHLRDEAQEYLNEFKLKELVQKYSEFINFPIYLWASKEVDVEVPGNEDEKFESTCSEEEEGDEKKSWTKKVKETTYEWELLTNDVKAIWLRIPKEVTDEDYTKFYHSLAKDFGEEKPLAWSHFTAEGDVEFKVVLFVPPKAPHDFSRDQGLVDSDILPLNVSREMLQQHSLRTIKKKRIRKVLDMIRKIAEEDPDEANDREKKVHLEDEIRTERHLLYYWHKQRTARKSPFLERLTKKNSEVIFFTDPVVDEYLMQYMMDYEGKKFQNVSNENVDAVKISNCLANTPCSCDLEVWLECKYGEDHAVTVSQTLSDSSKQAYMRGKRVLEISPRHPIIKELRESVVKDPESGFMLDDPKDFASRIYNSVKSSLHISPDVAIEEEEDAEETEVESSNKEASDEDTAAETSGVKDEL